MLLETLLFIILVLLVYLYIKQKYARFEGTGVPYNKPVLIFGNFWRSALKREHFITDVQRLYNEAGDERSKFVGAFSFMFPALMLKDPQIIKQVTNKDFDFFSEHQNGFQESVAPVLGKSLIALRGQKWRDMRAALSPVFTSSKIRHMCPFVSQCGKQMVEYLNSLCDENNIKYGEASVEIETKDMSSRFMTDVIATSIFGIETDSFQNQNNEFFLIGKNTLKFDTITLYKMLISMAIPWLAKLLRLRLFDEKIDRFFRDIVLNTMKYRRENNIVRRDMMQLLMEAKEGSLKSEKQIENKSDAGFATVEESDIGKREIKKVWEDDDLVAQAFIFFFGGFETSSTLSSFVLHELAINHDVQEKLRCEVDKFVQTYGQDVTYEMVQEMKYLDMVLSETLRKWPPNPLGDRLCIKNIDIGPPRDGERTSFTVKKGEVLWIPIYSIHHDKRYWEEPEKFDPERFSDENKHKIQPFTYLPFGTGPRNCIGSRFALMEQKVLIFHIIANFKVEICPKTTIPLVLDRKSLTMTVENGSWVKLAKRNIP